MYQHAGHSQIDGSVPLRLRLHDVSTFLRTHQFVAKRRKQTFIFARRHRLRDRAVACPIQVSGGEALKRSLLPMRCAPKKNGVKRKI